jgi:hypothetical protein
MIDEHDLRARFVERAAATPEPDDRTWRTMLARIEAPEPKRQFAWRVPVSFATAAVLVIVGGMLLVPSPRTDVPEKQEHLFAGPAPMPSGVPLPLPKQIKINTLKTSVHAVTSGAAVAPVNAPSATPALGDLQLARKGSIEIQVAAIEPALETATRIARDNGGTVTALHDAVAQSPDVVNGATLTILVPASRLDATVAALAGLGRVTSRTIDAESVGDAIVDTEARLRNLRHEEADLLAIMHRSGSVGDILDVEDKLADVRGQIESLEGERAELRRRVATAAIDVALREPPKPAPPWWMFWRRL